MRISSDNLDICRFVVLFLGFLNVVGDVFFVLWLVGGGGDGVVVFG